MLVEEAKEHWGNRAAASVESVKAVISGLTAKKKKKHKDATIAQQASSSGSSTLPVEVIDEDEMLMEVDGDENVDGDEDEVATFAQETPFGTAVWTAVEEDAEQANSDS